MSDKKLGLLGRKVGMTQVFDEGIVIPVTVVETGTNTVLAVKKIDGPDGYSAIQLGMGSRRERRTNRPMKGQFDKLGLAPMQFVKELRVPADVAAQHQPGSTLGAADVFSNGDFVDVTGTSKGRGFAGVVKRYGFRGFERSHGTHEYFRHGGSIGTRLTPGHVLKGKRMGGHYGASRVTTQNLKVVKVDGERNLLFIKGAIPGPSGGMVLVRKAVKKGQAVKQG